MTRPLLIAISLIVFPFFLRAQSTDELLEKAYDYQGQNLRDSAILIFAQAGKLFLAEGNNKKHIECLAGENRNYLKTDQIKNVEEKGALAIEIVDRGKVSENDEYFLEILTQLSRLNWYAKGNFPESIKYLDRASKICDQVDFDVSKREVQISTEYGYTYGYSGDFDNSEKYFRSALDKAIEIYGDSSEVVADRFTDMVFPLIQKSEWEKAEAALKRATELNIKLRGPDHMSVLKNYNNLGYIYLEKFDNDLAILYINKAISMIREKFGESHRSIGIGYMNLGASYHNKNEFHNSVKFSLKAYDNFMVSIGEKNPYMGIVLLNTANAYTYLNNADSAIYYYDKALKLKQELYGEQHHEIVNTYGYMSYFFITNELYEEAVDVISKAMSISDQILPQKHKLSANNHLYMSQYYAAIGDLDKSLEEVQKSIIGLVFDFNEQSLSSNPEISDNIISRRILIDALMHKTKVLKDYGAVTGDIKYLQYAFETAKVTEQAIDLLRIEYQTPESKELLVSRSKDFFENAVELSFALYSQNQEDGYLEVALGFIEKSKSILLIENLRSNTNFAKGTLPDSLANLEKSLSRSISMLTEQLFEARNQNDSAKTASLENKFFQNKRDYDLLLNHIEKGYPEYFSIQHNNISLSIKSVQDLIGAGSIWVNYFTGKSNIYVIGLTNNGEAFHKIPTNESLYKEIQNYVVGLGRRSFDPNYSNEIYAELVHPLLEHFENEPINQITVIPDGILFYLPFESFVTNQNGSFLIQSHAINYMHSMSLSGTSDGDKPDVRLDYLGFSPTFNKQSNALLVSRSASDIELASQLEYLPMAEKEIVESASLWNGRSMINNDASESNFKREAGNARIIHIASHTIIDDQDPMNSKLVFSPGADSVDDGLLHTYELYNMKLNAQLACLSACNTGFGNIRSGEGVVSLAKGFFYAGVPNIMMSLWAVPDVSTSKIVTTFYEELKKGAGKADALRNAKLKYLASADENTSDPYYWAALTMIGDNEPVKQASGFPYWIGLIFLAGGVVLWFRYKK